MIFRGRCGCVVKTGPHGDLHIALCAEHAPAPPSSTPTCQVHGTELYCAMCTGSIGGRMRTPAKAAASRRNASRPRPGARKPRGPRTPRPELPEEVAS